jgi:DNA-binding transcriptional ArsR family regulator
MTTHALAGALGITPDAVRRLLKPLTDADIITADRSSRAAVFGLARRTTVRRRGAVTEVAVTTDGNDMQIVLRLR